MKYDFDMGEWLLAKILPFAKCPKCENTLECLEMESERGDPFVRAQCINENCNLRMYIQVGLIENIVKGKMGW